MQLLCFYTLLKCAYQKHTSSSFCAEFHKYDGMMKYDNDPQSVTTE